MIIHDAARGYARAADAYERGRPEYPQEVVELVVRALALAPGEPLLELGAGTGKLSRLVAARGVRVLAVEPTDAMIRRIPRTSGAGAILPIRAVAEAVPLRDGAFGAAAAASAFHWFDGPRALAELHRAEMLWHE